MEEIATVISSQKPVDKSEETSDPEPSDEIIKNVTISINEYFEKFLIQCGAFYQCQLCLEKSPNKWVMLNHFLDIHSVHSEYSKSVKIVNLQAVLSFSA